MKKFSAFIFALCLFGLSAQAQTAQTYGKAFTETKVIPASKLGTVLGKQDSAAVQVTGTVKDVCKAKGCWMDIQLADNSVMKVKFKDYGFFVPKDITGKTVTLNGMAYNQEVSVADQKHYAEDAKKSKTEIAAIKKPKKSITYTASGVVIK